MRGKRSEGERRREDARERREDTRVYEAREEGGTRKSKRGSGREPREGKKMLKGGC